ncbi:MAG TPA: lysylphosphatidylglycerol synthase transmembrane domain-containing protein [Patescibacteria group bacterium]|nr:lysylphosphatidylglycerol synthase transmembrane domain-containing protein [Patescibacteria group bacterium]
MDTINKYFKIKKSTFIFFTLFIIASYVLIPQFSKFHSSTKYLSHPNLYFLTLALIFTEITFVAAALSYVKLAFKKIGTGLEILIQTAAAFINNILPAGIGGIGANYSFLKHEKHSSSEAASVVALNNFLGLTGHLTLVLIALVVASLSHQKIITSSNSYSNIFKTFGFIFIITLIAALLFRKNSIFKFINEIKTHLKSYKNRIADLIYVQLLQVALTISNVLALYYSARAVSINIHLIYILIIFTIGAGLKNATPTPGGLGGIEAGLLAGFLAYKVPVSQALAAVLFFRFVNFWIPLGIGFFTFIYANKQKYFST